MGELVRKQEELEKQRAYYRDMWLAQLAENTKLQEIIRRAIEARGDQFYVLQILGEAKMHKGSE